MPLPTPPSLNPTATNSRAGSRDRGDDVLTCRAELSTAPRPHPAAAPPSPATSLQPLQDFAAFITHTPPQWFLLILGSSWHRWGCEEGVEGSRAHPVSWQMGSSIGPAARAAATRSCALAQAGGGSLLGEPGQHRAERGCWPTWLRFGLHRGTLGDGDGTGTSRLSPAIVPSAPLTSAERPGTAAPSGSWLCPEPHPQHLQSLVPAPTSALPPAPQVSPAHPSSPAGSSLCPEGCPEPCSWARLWWEESRQRPSAIPWQSCKNETLESALDQNRFHFSKVR